MHEQIQYAFYFSFIYFVTSDRKRVSVNEAPIYNTALMGNRGSTYDVSLFDRSPGTNQVACISYGQCRNPLNVHIHWQLFAFNIKSPGKSARNRKRNSNTDVCRHTCIYYTWYCVKVNLCVATNSMSYTPRAWAVGKNTNRAACY
jgi:hypothetical protein